MDHGPVDPEVFVEYRLMRVADQLRRRFDAALRPHGLTARRFSVLAVLQARPGATSAELARAVLMTPQSMGALLDQLEADGHVEPRGRRGRGRAAPARLSREGGVLLASAAASVRALDDETRRVLGPGLGALTSALGALEDHLGVARPPT